jgi:aminopeptidase YwaD
MKALYWFVVVCSVTIVVPGQSKPPLLSEPVVAALANELSGETAKRDLEFISRQHRMRASKGISAAAEFVADQARSYGLEDVEILAFPADGRTFYGTQKSRPAWNAEFAELWEMGADGKPRTLIASWDAMPLVLAQDSESADVIAELVDVGAGTSESDYTGKDLRGKLVLVSAQPEAVYRLAVEKYGAVGILSYAQNQRTAWFGENDNLIRWGHLDSFTNTKTFGFMLSLKQARALQARLGLGEKVVFKAEVRAGREPGNYEIPTAVIRGSDPTLRDEEIAFSCHLDHPRPGANDNASGCVTILEVGRTLAKLIRDGKIKRPRRSIRFIWPPEIEGTLALLNARPDIAGRIKAVIHMDMVGGGPETKAVFHVTRGPASLPSFVNDVAEAFGEFVNEQSYRHASGENVPYPLVAPEGGKEPLNTRLAEFTMGSDHQVYTDSSFSIPAIYLNDWPDRYIHTNFDTPANIDPTKLKRAGFIGGASGYFLANATAADADTIWQVIRERIVHRTARFMQHSPQLDGDEVGNFIRHQWGFEHRLVSSTQVFLRQPTTPSSLNGTRRDVAEFIAHQVNSRGLSSPTPEIPPGDGRLVFKRNPAIKGTMSAFGYNYFTDKYGEERARSIRVLRYQGLWGTGGEYAYEVLNFADGKHNVQQIRDAVSAVYGPVPVELVLEYLRALETIDVVHKLD